MASPKKTRPAGRKGGSRGPKVGRTASRDQRRSELTSRIAAELEAIVGEARLYLEEVKVGRAGQRAVVKVVVDLPEGPGGVDSDALTGISRAISARLDDVDLVEGAYTLEVSTPGAERELTEARHFSRAQGRLVTLNLANGTVLNGRLHHYSGDTVSIHVGDGPRTVRIADVSSGRVRVELGKNGVDVAEEGED